MTKWQRLETWLKIIHKEQSQCSLPCFFVYKETSWTRWKEIKYVWEQIHGADHTQCNMYNTDVFPDRILYQWQSKPHRYHNDGISPPLKLNTYTSITALALITISQWQDFISSETEQLHFFHRTQKVHCSGRSTL